MYVKKGKHIQGWWMPRQEPDEGMPDPSMLVAWRGENARCSDIGVMVWGLNNPHPDKEIESVMLQPSKDNAMWVVLGITLSDFPVWLPPSGLSTGIPAPWSVGAVIWAMFEGLAGIYDAEPNFKTARIVPRWAAGETGNVTVTAKFEEGGGYVRYTYTKTETALQFKVAGSSKVRSFELLLPEKFDPGILIVDNEETEYQIKEVENSRYVCFESEDIAGQDIKLIQSK
jgi:hypothetical protein